MKQVLVLFLLINTTFLFAINKDTTLMTIGNRKISLGEFEYLQNKNNQVTTEDETSATDYVDMFANFKMKVFEAEDMGLDTAAAFVKELSGYRDQLAEPYLKDQNLDDKLVREAYDRLKEEVEASHILIRLNSDNPKDTLIAYNKALEAREKIINGTPFEEVAKQYSEDPSVKNNGGYLGYFSGFQMVLPFEEAAFNTPVGEISMPARSRFGYHIIKITNRRQSRGQINVSHILIFSNDKMDDARRAGQKKLAFNIYEKIQNGENFADMAKEYSDDHGTAERGGNIGFIKTGQTIPKFEETAYALEKKGDISEPVLTRFGWHIIRLEGKKELPPFEEEKENIKKRLARDSRGTQPEIAFLNKLKKEYNYTINQDNIDALYAYAKGKKLDSTLRTELMTMQDTIISFGDIAKTQCDLVDFTWEKKPNGTNFESQFAGFEKKALLDYEKSRLEIKYPDFKYLINEYHDGLLLFEISNQKVWEKASTDEAGLNKFYKKNKKSYTFRDSCFGGTVIYLKDSAALSKYDSLLTANNPVAGIKDSLNAKEYLMKTEDGFYKQGENVAVDYLVFGKGDSIQNESFAIVLSDGQIYEPEDIKPLDATRGAVISDYQDYLESKWIKSLHKKYKVKINKDLLETAKE